METVEFNFVGRQRYLYFKLMQQLTRAQRVWFVRKMTAWDVARSRAEIAKANPAFTDEEVRLKWVELAYGADLADRLRAYLRERQVQA